MKPIFLIIVFFLLLCNIAAQPNISDAKRNNFWITGYANPQINLPQPDTNFRATCYDFNSTPVSLTRRISALDIAGTCAAICDTTGQMLFYTNGIWVGNKNLPDAG